MNELPTYFYAIEKMQDKITLREIILDKQQSDDVDTNKIVCVGIIEPLMDIIYMDGYLYSKKRTDEMLRNMIDTLSR